MGAVVKVVGPLTCSQMDGLEGAITKAGAPSMAGGATIPLPTAMACQLPKAQASQPP